MRNEYIHTAPKVAIVSVNFNQPEFTRIMLESLRKITYPNVETWVVDNGSTKGDLEAIATEFPEVHFIFSEKNYGFAGGNNLALERLEADYVLLLNNDTEVDPGFLEPMVDRLEKHQEVGIVSPKIFFFDQPDTLQYAGTTPIHPITNRGKKFGYGEKDHGQFDEKSETAYPNGACMLFRGRFLQEVGLIHEQYFLYYEEHDFTWKIKERGNEVNLQPASKIWHKVSASTGKNSPLKTYYLHRNRQMFNRRNLSGMTFLLSSLYYFLFATPKALIQHMLKGDMSLASKVWEATIWHAKHLALPKGRLSESADIKWVKPKEQWV
ncbi:MAG: glycosyltransferase family 2 protein [Bacteroidota bacterium]